MTAVETFVQQITKDQSNGRSVSLANINIAKRTTDSSKDATQMGALKEFHASFRAANHCYDDLIPLLNKLSSEELTSFLNSIDPGSPKTSNEDALASREILLYLKLLLRYRISISPSRDTLLDFSSNALSLYTVSLDQHQLLPEACFLAVVALLRLGEVTDDHSTDTFTHLMPCILLLRHCLKTSEDFFPAQLLLIRLYLLVGCVSLAFMEFRKLSVKNMQWETLGHIVTNRISTIHPQATGNSTPSEDTQFSPSDILATTVSVAENSQRLLTRGIMQGLNLGSYANVLEAVQIRSQAASSLNTQIAILEKRDVEMMNGAYDTTSPNIRSGDLVDRREFSTFSILDDLDASWTSPLQVAPLQREAWLAVMLFQGEVWRMLTDDTPSGKDSNSKSLTILERALAATLQVLSAHEKDFTRSEQRVFGCYEAIARAILASKSSDKSRMTDAPNYVRTICEWLKERRDGDLEAGNIVDLRIPTWDYLHEAYTVLKVLHFLQQLVSSLHPNERSKSSDAKLKTDVVSSEDVQNIGDLLLEVVDKLMKTITSLKAGLRDTGVLEKLMGGIAPDTTKSDGQPGVLIEGLIETYEQETFCGELRDSWEEALDALLSACALFKKSWLKTKTSKGKITKSKTAA